MALLVADASPVVGFVAAGEHPLLWQVVSTVYGHLLVPHHVDGEISRTAAKKSRKAATNYAWMKQQGQVTVLDEVTVVDPVAATAATLLGVGPRRQFDEREKDVGEALTVAHAKHLRRQGHPADVGDASAPGDVRCGIPGFDHPGTEFRGGGTDTDP